MKVRWVFFYIVFTIEQLLFGYYLVCFCNIYEEVINRWLTSSFISFGIDVALEFGLPLVGMILRIIAIKTKFQ